MIVLCAKAKDAFACPPFISPRGWSFPMSSSSGWPTASSRTNAPLTGKATGRRKATVLRCDHPGGTFLHLVFPMLSNQKGTPVASCKVAFEGTARVAVRIAQRSLILSATTGRVERFQAPRQRVRKIVLRVQGQKQSPPSKQGAVMPLGKPND